MKFFFNFLYMGGYYFTLPMTVIALVIIYLTVRASLELFVAQKVVGPLTGKKLDTIIYLGLFAFVAGIFGQMIGLYSAFEYIGKTGNISPKMLGAGLKVSMITTLYGTFILLFTSIGWFVLRRKMKSLLANQGED